MTDLINLLPPQLQALLMGGLLLSSLCSIIISGTATPPPNTIWGRIYAGLEKIALIYGRAKQEGLPVLTTADIQANLIRMLSSKQTITPESLANMVGLSLPAPLPGSEPTPTPIEKGQTP